MPYSENIRFEVAKAPKTIGNQLGRWAIHLDFPVIKIAQATGATRQTVYNWFKGGEVLQAYKNNVNTLIKILQSSPTAEDAWRKTCKTFDLRH
jgi:hypothetical protein